MEPNMDHPHPPPPGHGHPPPHHGGAEKTTAKFYNHATARRIDTQCVIATTLKRHRPRHHHPPHQRSLLLRKQIPHRPAHNQLHPPARRIDNSPGFLIRDIIFAKYMLTWQSKDFILYIADGRDGSSAYPQIKNNYILSPSTHLNDSLILAAGKWSDGLQDEIWVYDGGWWQKSRELWESIQSASWENVILDEDMKQALIQDHLNFFESRETYSRLKVPWKRGVIYWGPPGNGKTISIKAMMKTLLDREESVPSLYVRSLVSYAGPEYALSQIFQKARQFAPCYLIFEDLDSLVSDNVRSYFLNEVDGLKSNDGIFMIGSTNHLERLDPGISKRPSRFDRKYLFPNPDLGQRVMYCRFWQNKLRGNEAIEFPDVLTRKIAGITEGFSFAYIQEAFVASLLAIARDSKEKEKEEVLARSGIEDDWERLTLEDSEDGGGGDDGGDDDDDDDGDEDLEKYVLWVEIKKQVAILREGIEKED
ncbi:P-loop containing nucleoside triphosphate hydrolase protein [Sordaria brevicollis]|uniref:P-loop containing nucleoside triphosphate hydrolase protein n=1 Tax=Sordaria brevicollis TaxID=83679 RepID=A0AAE0PG42_SORBR|nr:P-loop containing nucleoside triphosphate hydrolase protein [Sordaria brevicollis]